MPSFTWNFVLGTCPCISNGACRTWNGGIPFPLGKGRAARVSQAASSLPTAQRHALSVQEARSQPKWVNPPSRRARGVLCTQTLHQAATTSPIASATRATQDRMEKSVWNASLAHTRRRRAMPPARLAHRANTRPRELQLMRAHASNVQSTRTHRRGRHHLRSACATQGIQARSPMPISATRAM